MQPSGKSSATGSNAGPSAHTVGTSPASSLLTPHLSLARQQVLHHVAEQYRSSRSQVTTTTTSAVIDPNKDEDAPTLSTENDVTTEKTVRATAKPRDAKAIKAEDEDADEDGISNGQAVHSPTTSSASGTSHLSSGKVRRIQKGAAPISSKRRALAQRRADEAAQAERAEMRRAVQLARAQERHGAASTTSDGGTGPDDGACLATNTTLAPTASDSTGSPATVPSIIPHHHHHHHHHHSAHHHSAHHHPPPPQQPFPFMLGLIDEYRQEEQRRLTNLGSQNAYTYGYSSPVPGGYDDEGAIRDAYGGPPTASPFPAQPPSPHGHPYQQQSYTTHTFGGMQRYLQRRDEPRQPSLPPLSPPTHSTGGAGTPSRHTGSGAAAGGGGGRPHFSVRAPEVSSAGGTDVISPLLAPPPSYSEAAWVSVPPPLPNAPGHPVGPPPSYTATVGSAGARGSGDAGGCGRAPLLKPSQVVESPSAGGSATATIVATPHANAAPGLVPRGGSGSARSPHTEPGASPLSYFATATAGGSYAKTTPLADRHAFSTAPDTGIESCASPVAQPTLSSRGAIKRTKSGTGVEDERVSPLPRNRQEAYMLPPPPLLAGVRLDQPWAISCSQGSPGRAASPPKTKNSSAVAKASMESEYVLQLLPTWSLLTSGLIYESAENSGISTVNGEHSSKRKAPAQAPTQPRLQSDGVLSVFPVHLSEVMMAEQVLTRANLSSTANSSPIASLPDSPTAPVSPTSSLPSTTSQMTQPRYYCAEVELELMVRPPSAAKTENSTPQCSQSLLALQRSQRLLKALRELEDVPVSAGGGTGGDSGEMSTSQRGRIASDDLAALLNDAVLSVLRLAPRFDSICDALMLASMPSGTPSPVPGPNTTVSSSLAAPQTATASAAPTATSALTRELLDVLGAAAVSPGQPLGLTRPATGSCGTASVSDSVTTTARELQAALEDEHARAAVEEGALHLQLALPPRAAYVDAQGTVCSGSHVRSQPPRRAAASPAPPSAQDAPARRMQLLSSLVVPAAGAEHAFFSAPQPIGLQVEVVKTEAVSGEATAARVVLRLSLALRDTRTPPTGAAAIDDSEIFTALTAVLPAPLLFSSHTRRVSVRPFGSTKLEKTDGEEESVADSADSAVECLSADVLAQWIQSIWGPDARVGVPARPRDALNGEVQAQETSTQVGFKSMTTPAETAHHTTSPDDRQTEEAAVKDADQDAPECPVDAEASSDPTDTAVSTVNVRGVAEADPVRDDEAEARPAAGHDAVAVRGEARANTLDCQGDVCDQPALAPSSGGVAKSGTREIYVNTMAAPLADLLQKLYTALRACRQAAIAFSVSRGVSPLETTRDETRSGGIDLAQRRHCTIPASLLQVLHPSRHGVSKKGLPSGTTTVSGGGRQRQRGRAAEPDESASQMGASVTLLSQAFTIAAAASDLVLSRHAVVCHRQKTQPVQAASKVTNDSREKSACAASARWAEVMNPESSLLHWMEAHVLPILLRMEAALTTDAVAVAAVPLTVCAPSASPASGVSCANATANGAGAASSPATTVVGSQRVVTTAAGKRGHRRAGGHAAAAVAETARPEVAGRVISESAAAQIGQSALHPLHYLYQLLRFAEQDALTVGPWWSQPLSWSNTASTVVPTPPPAATFASAYCLHISPADTQAETRVRGALRQAAAQLQSLISEMAELETSVAASRASETLWDDVLVPYLTAVAASLASEEAERDQIWEEAQRGRHVALLHEQQQRHQAEEEQEQEESEQEETCAADVALGGAATEEDKDVAAVVPPVHLLSGPQAPDAVAPRGAAKEMSDGHHNVSGDGDESTSPPPSTPRRVTSALASTRTPKPSTQRTGGCGKTKRPLTVSSKRGGINATNNTPAKPRAAQVLKSTQKQQEARQGQSDVALIRSLLFPFLGVAVLTALFLYFA